MKQFAFLLALLITLPVFSQKIDPDELPETILQSLNKEYPDAKVKGWEMVGEEFQARTRLEGSTAYISFSILGTYLRTSYPLDPRELPSAILNYVNENFTDVNFYISDLVESADGTEYYDIELRKVGLAQGKLAELRFDPMGKLTHREVFKVIEPEPENEALIDPPKKKKEKKEKVYYEDEVEEEAVHLPESLVPSKVKTGFERRFRNAEELVWDTISGNYVASFFQGDMQRYVFFSKDGQWVMSKEEMPPDAMYSPILRFINEEYSNEFRIDYAEKTTKNDRSTSYYVELSQQIRGLEYDPITSLYFDKTGRLEKVESPEIPMEEYPEDDILADPEFDAMLEDDLGDLKSGEPSDGKIRENELPSNIPSYIYAKYPEIKIRESVIDQDAEWGTVYRVVVSKEGLMQDTYNLFFDRKGNMLQDNVPADLFAKKEAKRAASQEYEEEDLYEDRTTISSSSVPEAVTNYFNRRFPRAEETQWTEEDEYFTARFFGRELENKVTFNAAGEILRTKTEMAPDRYYRPIVMYVEENYPKYDIDYAEKIIRKDRINYYYVELYTRKRDLPSTVYLYFDKMGKPIDEEPEL